MHMTGGSNSVKNSPMQYRELGARTQAMLLSAATKVVLKNACDFKLIGQPTTLKVSRAKSNGTQAYGIDVQLPGLLTAVIVRPPVFNGGVSSFDATAALKIQGVRAVLPVDLDRGGKGIAIIANGYWPAKMARDVLKVQWNLAGLARADSATLTAQFRALAQQPGLPAPQEHFNADISALAGAPNKITAEFSFPCLNHAQLEPLACTVDLKADSCTLYTASQMPGVDAGATAALTGLKPEQVQVVVQMAGGGFGRRATPTAEYVREAVGVAKALAAAGKAAPVKVVWRREDDMQAGYYRPLTVHRAEIGFDAQGRALGWDPRIVSQSILAGSPFEAFMVQKGVDMTATEGMREPCAIPMKLSVHHPKVNAPVLRWRAVGSTHTAYVMETLLDEIAVATQQDPVAHRMALMGSAAKSARHRAALQLAVDKSGYGTRKLPAGTAWGVALHESFESVVAYVVEARMQGTGKNARTVLSRVTAGVHCNLCVNPLGVQAQVEGSVVMALATTLPGHHITLKYGVVQQSNYHQSPMPRLADAPLVQTFIVPSSDPPKGMGEPALPPLAPALANAVARLTGKRHRESPFKLA